MPRGVYKRTKRNAKVKTPSPPAPSPSARVAANHPSALDNAHAETVQAYEMAAALRARIERLQEQCELSERSHIADKAMVEQMQFKLKLITLFTNFVLTAKFD